MNDAKALIKKIKETYDCKATNLGSEDLIETFRGETVWEGTVHIFNTLDHPDAYHIYGWGYQKDDQSEDREYVTVLAIPPIDTPRKAVQSYVASQA